MRLFYAQWVSESLPFLNRATKGSMLLTLEYGVEPWYQTQIDLCLLERYAKKPYKGYANLIAHFLLSWENKRQAFCELNGT
jgi:hypothetical protein